MNIVFDLEYTMKCLSKEIKYLFFLIKTTKICIFNERIRVIIFQQG